MDIQRANIDEKSLEGFYSPVKNAEALNYLRGFSKAALASLIENSERILMLFGNGAKGTGANETLQVLAKRYGIPVVTSLLGKGLFYEDDPLAVGMIGSYGNRCANLAIANADLVIVVGARLDTRQTGTSLDSFVRGGSVVRLDIDADELANHRLLKVKPIQGSAETFARELSSIPWKEPCEPWLLYIEMLKRDYGQDAEIIRNVENKRPYQVMDILNRFAANDQVFTVDIGQNQMFAAQKLRIRKGQAWRTSGGLAPMGFALPFAIGTAFATRGVRPIFAITGDGGLHMSAQSLLTIAQHHLPIKVILLNNRSLGMITQFQDLYFDQRKEGTTKESGYLVPDFRLLAESSGLTYHYIAGNDFRNETMLGDIFKARGSAVIEFDIGENTVVYPKLEVNRPLDDLNPRLDREELQKVMLVPIFDDKK
jgi:acetolactate synthase-1/2/3 large subunit